MYTHILHATDLSEKHLEHIQHAVALAKKLAATLYVLHVIEPPKSLQIAQGLGFAEFYKPQTDTAWAVMQSLATTVGLKKDNLFVEVGSIKTHVMDKIKALDCTLLILGQHIDSPIPLMLQSSAHELFQDISIDVLVLR